MTYCLAIALEEGLVFCSDSRTNAGADRVSSYSKMHRFAFPGERSLVLLSAGNLATSQAVVAQIHRDLEAGESAPIRSALNALRHLSLGVQWGVPCPWFWVIGGGRGKQALVG